MLIEFQLAMYLEMLPSSFPTRITIEFDLKNGICVSWVNFLLEGKRRLNSYIGETTKILESNWLKVNQIYHYKQLRINILCGLIESHPDSIFVTRPSSSEPFTIMLTDFIIGLTGGYNSLWHCSLTTMAAMIKVN